VTPCNKRKHNESFIIEDELDIEDDPDYVDTLWREQKKRLKISQMNEQANVSKLQEAILSETMTSNLDRNKMSCRKATSTFGLLARSAGESVEKLTLSKQTVYRSRIRNRSTICSKVGSSIYL
jgi:hypothetical protein